MPTGIASKKLKSKFAHAKKKLKDIGITAAFAGAALAPFKGAAQDRIVDAQNHTVSLVLDTISMGMSVVNKSSPNKIIQIHNGGFGDMNQYVKDNAEGSRATTLNIADDIDGHYYTVLKGTMVKKGENTYEYNTDKLYNKYFEMAKLVFPKTKMSGPVYIKVYLVGTMDQVLLFCKSVDGHFHDCFGTMILDGAHDMILHYKKFDNKYENCEIEEDINLVLYQSKKDKDKRTLRVYDAAKRKGYVYKISGKGGLVRAYQVRSGSDMDQFSKIDEYWHRGLNSPYRY